MEKGNLMDNHDNSQQVDTLTNQSGDSANQTSEKGKNKSKSSRFRNKHEEEKLTMID